MFNACFQSRFSLEFEAVGANMRKYVSCSLKSWNLDLNPRFRIPTCVIYYAVFEMLLFVSFEVKKYTVLRWGHAVA
jgi:hypothetical protein